MGWESTGAVKLTSVEVYGTEKEWSTGTVRTAVRYCINRRHGHTPLFQHFVTNNQKQTEFDVIVILDGTGCFLS